ncbi:MAG: tRNA dihydrouridine(20/20a) synthase DusA [Pseudomonadota bacterium]
MTKPATQQLSVAPMMDWTDRHCRYFHRLLAPGARLYTEMVTTGAIIHGDRERLLGFDPAEHPVALQIGGSNPDELAEAAKIGEDFGYDEINLNVGCPSDRVQNGCFGAVLMRRPDLVADCLAAMRAAVRVPVTVKHRLGVDEQDEVADLETFIKTVRQSGVTTFIVHARKAWLSGLSPKENRTVPPLNYPRVYQLAADYPELSIVINGGIDALAALPDHLDHCAGVMIGRAAYQTPYLLAQAESQLTGAPLPSRELILEAWRPYVETQLARGTPLKHMTRHVLGLYAAQPGGRRWRRVLSEKAHLPAAGWDVVAAARAALEPGSRSAA